MSLGWVEIGAERQGYVLITYAFIQKCVRARKRAHACLPAYVVLSQAHVCSCAHTCR